MKRRFSVNNDDIFSLRLPRNPYIFSGERGGGGGGYYTLRGMEG